MTDQEIKTAMIGRCLKLQGYFNPCFQTTPPIVRVVMEPDDMMVHILVGGGWGYTFSRFGAETLIMKGTYKDEIGYS